MTLRNSAKTLIFADVTWYRVEKYSGTINRNFLRPDGSDKFHDGIFGRFAKRYVSSATVGVNFPGIDRSGNLGVRESPIVMKGLSRRHFNSPPSSQPSTSTPHNCSQQSGVGSVMCHSPLLTDDEWTGSCWSSALMQARKLLNLPEQPLNAQLLDSAQLQMVGRRLVGDGNSAVTRKQLEEAAQRRSLEPRAIITLLVAETAAVQGEFKTDPADRDDDEDRRQRRKLLAAASELMHGACLMHRSVNMYCRSPAGPSALAVKPTPLDRLLIMAGDLLFSGAFGQLAQVRHSGVFEQLSATVTHMTEAALEPPSVEGAAGWARRHHQLSGTQLANSCSAVLQLSAARHSTSRQLIFSSYQLGKHIALAWQARADIEHVSSTYRPLRSTALPVSLLLEQDPQLARWLLQVLRTRPLDNTESQQVRQLVVDSGLIHQAELVLESHATSSRELLSQFPCGQASDALFKLIDVIASR